MEGLSELVWYNVLLAFGTYAIVFSVFARALKLGHVLGIVLGVSLMLAYFTREIFYSLLPTMPPLICVLFGFAALLISNFIVDAGH